MTSLQDSAKSHSVKTPPIPLVSCGIKGDEKMDSSSDLTDSRAEKQGVPDEAHLTCSPPVTPYPPISTMSDIVVTSSVPSIWQHSADLNISALYPHNPNSNSSVSSPLSAPNYGLSYFTMTFGALSNLTALATLAKSYTRFHRRAKTPFLLLAAALLLTDLAGHLVTGSFGLYLHLQRVQRQRAAARVIKPTQAFCKLFGACMVFFGLSPLLLGCAMAVERCLGITQSLHHSAVVTTTHVRLSVLLLFAVALILAVLPLLGVGSYKLQFPGTWCFLPVQGSLSTADISLVLIFSSLGLVALTVSVFCNTTSGLTLLQARFSNQGLQPTTSRRHGQSSSLQSLDVEMMVQLAVINVVSWVCWSPFLIYIIMSVKQFYRGTTRQDEQYEQPMFLLVLRMASWNQILDPWVYILLRRAVLCRVCGLVRPNRAILTQTSYWTGSERHNIHLH